MLNTEEQNLHHHTNDGEVLVRVENVSKKFCSSLKKSLWYGVQDIGSEMMGIKYDHELRPDEFWSVKDVSFELRRGECLGLVGRNGAGKSYVSRELSVNEHASAMCAVLAAGPARTSGPHVPCPMRQARATPPRRPAERSPARG